MQGRWPCLSRPRRVVQASSGNYASCDRPQVPWCRLTFLFAPSRSFTARSQFTVRTQVPHGVALASKRLVQERQIVMGVLRFRIECERLLIKRDGIVVTFLILAQNCEVEKQHCVTTT